MSGSQFPERYRLEAPQLQSVLAGAHALACTAVAHCGIYHAKAYPTDLEEGGRLHHLVASTIMGIDRPRVIAEGAVRNALTVIDFVGREAERQYQSLQRRDYAELYEAVDNVLTEARAIQPDVIVVETPEVLSNEIDVPGLPHAERDAWVLKESLSLLAIAARHPHLRSQLNLTCARGAKKAYGEAEKSGKKAESEEHKRFGRSDGGFHLPGTADAMKLARSEVAARREEDAQEMAGAVYSTVASATQADKTAAAYIVEHREDLVVALEGLREGVPHLSLDNTIPADVVLKQVPEPTSASGEFVAVLYDAIARHRDTPAEVARALFTAVAAEIEQQRLDPVLAIQDYLADAGYDPGTFVARATDELLAPALSAHAEKASALLSGNLTTPTTYVVHTSPYPIPFYANGLFEAELRVSDPALEDVVAVVSLYPYRLKNLVFYPEARTVLSSPDANRFYTNPSRKPQPPVKRTPLSTPVPAYTPANTAEEVVLPGR